MSHRPFPVNVTQATICAYFWVGIAAGVISFECSKEWAFSVVEALDDPPIQVIEIATANDRMAAMDALRAAAGGADQQAGGYWLLADLHDQLGTGRISAAKAVRSALHVARATDLPESIYYDFDGLDDELQLVVNGAHGALEVVESHVLNALKEHSATTAVGT